MRAGDGEEWEWFVRERMNLFEVVRDADEDSCFQSYKQPDSAWHVADALNKTMYMYPLESLLKRTSE